jgi:hypothetical protein
MVADLELSDYILILRLVSFITLWDRLVKTTKRIAAKKEDLQTVIYRFQGELFNRQKQKAFRH